MDQTATLVGFPEELPRRRRAAQRSNGVPVHLAKDAAVAQRVYEWMIAQGWSGPPDRECGSPSTP